MVKKPLTLDHYTFINQLLDLKDTNRLEPKIEITDKDKIINQLIAQQKVIEAMKNAEAQENALKLQRVIDTLKDENKRKHYDEALTNLPNIELKLKDKEKGGLIVSLVPIQEIINEFDAFQKEMLELKDKDGKPLFEQGNFKYEKQDGPPVVHVFTFPDEATANAFLERLFNKNMAMFPNGSQNTESIRPAQETKKSADSYKEALKEAKAEQNQEMEHEHSSPSPLKTKI